MKTDRLLVGGVAVALAIGLSAHAHADITPNHNSQITTNACEDILLGWSDGQIFLEAPSRRSWTRDSTCRRIRSRIARG